MHKSLILLPLALLGTGATASAQELGPEATARSVAGWPMPWQISRVNATALRSEDIVTAWVWGKGFVRGTPAAIASIGKPLPNAAGPNRTAAPCAEQIKSAAANARAASMEWAPASREYRLKNGNYFGVVEFRITYPTSTGYDIRNQPLVCVTTADGTVLDAYMAENKDAVETESRWAALPPRKR